MIIPVFNKLTLSILINKQLPESEEWVSALLQQSGGSVDQWYLRMVFLNNVDQKDPEEDTANAILTVRSLIDSQCGSQGSTLREDNKISIIADIFEADIKFKQKYLNDVLSKAFKHSRLSSIIEKHPGVITALSFELRSFSLVSASTIEENISVDSNVHNGFQGIDEELMDICLLYTSDAADE